MIVNAAICKDNAIVHFNTKPYTGGVVEFTTEDFMKVWQREIYSHCIPPGNFSSLNISAMPHLVTEVQCMPLSKIIHKAHVKHINYFILDVEGGELSVLKSIDWKHVIFDVLCIETEPNNRPIGYVNQVTTYLANKGYVNATGQVGRNTW